MATEKLLEDVHKLLDAQDDDMLMLIKSLLEEDKNTSEADFWDNVPEAAKEGIREGLAQLDRGEGISGDEVRKRIKDEFGF